MSHRITTQTQIKDRDVAVATLKTAGYLYEERGSVLRITSGQLKGVYINLQTGLVTGDSDPGYGGHKKEDMNLLKGLYAEQKLLKEFANEGIQIQSREETMDEIILHARVG